MEGRSGKGSGASGGDSLAPSDRVIVCRAAPWCCVWSLFNVVATIALGYFVLHSSKGGATFGGPLGFRPPPLAGSEGVAREASEAGAVALRGAAQAGTGGASDVSKCPGPAPPPADAKALVPAAGAPSPHVPAPQKVIYVPQIGCEPVEKLMIVSYTNVSGKSWGRGCVRGVVWHRLSFSAFVLRPYPRPPPVPSPPLALSPFCLHLTAGRHLVGRSVLP